MPHEENEGTKPKLRSVVGRLAHIIDEVLPTGDVADLRRMSPERADSPAFWRILASELEDGPLWLAGTTDRDEAESRWATILSGLAFSKGTHQAGKWAGQALGEAGYAETRFAKLLRSSSTNLRHEVRVAGRFLANKGQAVDWTNLAELVFTDGTDRADSIRRSLARGYYRIVR